MNDVVVAWKKGIWDKNRIYPEIDDKIFLGLIRLFDADKNEQIFVHREGEKVYYVYLWRLSKFDYISLGLLTNKLCLDYYELLRIFRTFVKDMAVNKLCVYNSKHGKIKLSSNNIQKQPRQRTLLDINIKNLKAQLDEKQKRWNNLPSQKFGILKSDVVPCTLEIQGSSWIVTQVSSGYRNVCISIREDISPLNKGRHSKDANSIASIINSSLQFLPKPSNTAKSAKTLKSLNMQNGEKRRKKRLDWIKIFARSVVGVLSVLFNWVAPWFIQTMLNWQKVALIAITNMGAFLMIYAVNNTHKGKYVTKLGWSGTVAILFSTILNVYGIFGGFASNEVEKQIDSLQWAIDNHNIPTLTRYARLDSTRAYYPLSIELWAQNRDTLNSLINIRKAIKVIDSKDSLYENCLDQLEELKTALDYYNTIAHKAPALPASPEERLTVLSNENSIIKRATVIAEKYSFDYTPNPEILKRIDDDFRRWIYVGDHSVLHTTKKDCYNAALQLKEDPEVKKKLDNLK